MHPIEMGGIIHKGSHVVKIVLGGLGTVVLDPGNKCQGRGWWTSIFQVCSMYLTIYIPCTCTCRGPNLFLLNLNTY